MSKKEINKGFIDYLRLNFGTINWIFDKTEQSEIVPKELTHGYLLSNFNIDDSIYKYYHLPTSNLLSDSEFQKMKDTGFVGNKETALRPYSNIIYGAYYSRSDLVWKLTGASHMQMFIDGKEIKYFADLIPYFKEYAKGFQDGFNEFDNKQINPFLTPFPEKQDYVNKVFEYITKNLFFKHGWANLTTGFTTNQHEEIVAAFEDGQQQGYFYRAWSTVFSNNNLFAPLFQEYFKALPPQPIKTKQPTEKKTLSDLITHQKSVEIVKGIKIQYKNIKGKRLKLLLLALQELNLLPNERIAQKFHDCCKAEFGWYVASYTAMNDYQFNENTDKIELDNMKKFLEKTIQTK